MSKNSKVVLIVSAIALVGIVGAGIVVGMFFSRGSDFANFYNIFGRNMIEIDESEALTLDGVSAIAIDCDSADIEFVDAQEAKVSVVGKILGGKDTQDVLEVYEEGGVLHIKARLEAPFINVSTGLDMTVYLPSDSMLDLRIDCTSGDIVMDGMQFGNIDIDKTSGKARISRCTADAVEYKSMSGDTDIAQCDFNSLCIKNTSGQIDIADMPGTIMIDSSSGDIDIAGAKDAIDIVSTSGGVSIDYAGADVAPITVKVKSGRTRLYFDAQAAFNLKAKVTSGDINTDMDIMVSGSLGKEIVGDNIYGQCNGGGELVNITTTSGGIDILKK